MRLSYMLIGLYLLVVLWGFFSPKDFLAVAFDREE
jgi:hypothetical protein